jgi:hypothetical protein
VARLVLRVFVPLALVVALCLGIAAISTAQDDEVHRHAQSSAHTDNVIDNEVGLAKVEAVGSYLHAKIVEEVGTYIFSREMADVVSYVNFVNEVARQDQLRRIAALAPPAPRSSPQPQQHQNSAVTSSSNPGDFLSCVRNRESGGNYNIYNSGGSGAAGAYQFLPGTWNSTAASSGRGDLVGVDPAQASPADQDAMAQALYAQQGAAPWGGGCG